MLLDDDSSAGRLGVGEIGDASKANSNADWLHCCWCWDVAWSVDSDDVCPTPLDAVVAAAAAVVDDAASSVAVFPSTSVE